MVQSIILRFVFLLSLSLKSYHPTLKPLQNRVTTYLFKTKYFYLNDVRLHILLKAFYGFFRQENLKGKIQKCAFLFLFSV